MLLFSALFPLSIMASDGHFLANLDQFALHKIFRYTIKVPARLFITIHYDSTSLLYTEQSSCARYLIQRCHSLPLMISRRDVSKKCSTFTEQVFDRRKARFRIFQYLVSPTSCYVLTSVSWKMIRDWLSFSNSVHGTYCKSFRISAIDRLRLFGFTFYELCTGIL